MINIQKSFRPFFFIDKFFNVNNQDPAEDLVTFHF